MIQDRIVLKLPHSTEFDLPKLVDRACAHGFSSLEISSELIASQEPSLLHESIEWIIYLGNVNSVETNLDDLKKHWCETIKRLTTDHIRSVNVGFQSKPTHSELEELQTFFKSIPVEGMLTVANGQLLLDYIPNSVNRFQIPINPLERKGRTRTNTYDIPLRGYDLTCGGLFTEQYAQLNANIEDQQMENHHPDFSRKRPLYVQFVKEVKQQLQNEIPKKLPLECLIAGWVLNNDVESIRWPYWDTTELSFLTSLNDFIRRSKTIEPLPSTEPFNNSGPPHFVQPPPHRPLHAPERYQL